MELSELTIYKKVLPKREASYVPYPEDLLPEIKDFLMEQGINKLYSHQAEMFTKVQEHKNVVITTATASGKTLSFLLPVIQELLKNPLHRAIFIYPTKALASDQFRAIQPYIEYFGANKINAGVYDGDTPTQDRARIRKSANLILTNPEMINGAFLPNHSSYGFDFIFSNLKYIVIDELHTYRGAFGSHLANVMRRFQRVCNYYKSSPQFLCSSATIANPVELAQEICGQKFSLVNKDGSPAPERTYQLMQPPEIKGANNNSYGRIAATTVASHLVPDLVEQQHSFITFAKSRRNVELIVKESRDRLEESLWTSSLKEKLSGYRGGYTPIERKEIERKMISGELYGLVSTNALELGIDIGKLDTTVLVGYPGTRASFWQQTGRAGRSGNQCVNYLILNNLPMDQYIAIDPDWLFDNASENAVVDKDNLQIQLAHIRAASAELPLSLNDISLFPDLGEVIPVLIKAKELMSQNGKFLWSGKAYPAGDFSLRNIDPIRFKLMNKENGKEITEMDELQAYHEIHDGAVYMHDAMLYLVTSIDTETRLAQAVPFTGNYYTVPQSNVFIRILQQFKEQDYMRTHLTFGDINVDESISCFKKLQFHNHQNLGFEGLSKLLSKDYETESTWIKLPSEVVEAYRNLVQIMDSGDQVKNDHFYGIAYALKTAAMMVTMTETEDIGAHISNNAYAMEDDSNENVYLYIYDKYVGGLGYSEKLFDLIPTIIDNAIKLVGGCPCKDGCPACVGDYELDKSMVLWGIKSLKEKTVPPKEIKIVNSAPKTLIQKPFYFKDLPKKWKEFGNYAAKNGDTYAQFLKTIEEVYITDTVLHLMVSNTFYREWILQEENKKSLLNIIRYYTVCPANITIEVESKEDKEKQNEIRSKLQRRYETLREE